MILSLILFIATSDHSSEIFDLAPLTSAEATTHAELVTISIVITPYCTLPRPLALGKLVLRHISAFDRFPMTSIAKVSVAPTEPNSQRTTESALERNVLVTMALALGNTLSRTAARANQLFGVKLFAVSLLLHGLCTVLTASKVGFMTIMTFEVCINGHCILSFVFVKGRLFIFKFVILVITFMFQTFQCFLLDFVSKCFILV